jgi:hypothetical protein
MEATSIIQQEAHMHFDDQSPSRDASARQTYAEPAGEPCAEAMFAMRVAGEVARQLHEAGRELRFTIGPSAARVEVLLCDVDGIVLSRMSPLRALEIATGAPW